MADIDTTLEIKIESDAKQANAELDKLIQKLGLVSQRLSTITGGKSMQDLSSKTKIVDANFKEISSSAKKTAESISKPMTQATKDVSQRIAQVKEQFKDMGKGYEFTGSFDQARRKIEVFSNALQNAKDKVQSFEIRGDVFGKMYEHAVEDAIRYENRIDILKEKIQGTANITPFQNMKASTQDVGKQLEEIGKTVDKFDKTAETGLFEKIDIRPFEATMKGNITKELEDSLSRLQSFDLSSTDAEFQKWKATINDVKSALDYIREMNITPKNIISSESTGATYSEDIKNFVDNFSTGLDRVKESANSTSAEVQRMIASFKPTQLNIGESYSKEFLEIQKAIEKTEKQLNSYYAKQEQNQRLGINPNTQVNRRLADNIKQAESELLEYKKEMVWLQQSGGDVIKSQVSGFEELQSSISNTGSVLSKLATIFRAIGMTDIAAPLQKWSRVANQAGSAVGEMGSKAQAAGATAGAAMGKASTAASGFMSKVAAGASKFGYVGIAIAAVIVSIATRVKILKAELNAVKKIVTTLAKGFTALWSAVGRLGKNILAFGTGSYNAVTPVGKAIQKIIGLFKSRVLRQAITKALQYVGEGFEKLNEYSMSIGSDFHRNMSMIYSDLKLLGRTIATAFEPLINVAAPMIDFIIHKVIDLINVVNQAFAAITGAETWTKATYAMEEWGKEANKAGGSAKKLSKQLGAWEDINNITTNEPGGGGGGGGTDAIDIEKMFTTENVNEKIKAYMDRIKQAWETDADFTFVGNDIAQKLSDALQKINWLEIQAGARKLGKGLATLINGFIEFPYMAERIGANIAQAINTVIATFSGFVQNIHFDSVGEFIGNGIGSAIDRIHWNEIIGDLSTLGEGLANGINALLRTGVLSKIAKATGNLLRAGISGAYKFITTTDFINAGKEVGKAITEFFSTMNEIDPTTGLTAFEELGKGITDLSHGIEEFVVNAINNIDDTAIKQGFRDFFEELDFTSILLDCTIVVSQIEKGLLGLIWDGVSSFFSGNSDQLADDIEVSFGDTLQKGIDGGIDNVKLATNWLYENVLKKGWENIRISSDWIVEKVGKAVNTGIQNIKISANWLYENILKKGWENIQISSDWIVTKVGDIVRQGIQNIKLSANWVYENVLKQGWENIQVSSDWLVGSIAGALEKAFTKLKEKWQEITSWWDTNKSKLSEVTLNVKSPHISITWDTTSAAATAMQKMFKLKGMPKFDVQYYAQGGFPEDGWFRASQGEIMGQFDNGKSVVANNNQITSGIASAVYEGNKENNALMRQEITVLRQQNEILQRLLEKESGISASSLFNSVQQSADEYYRRTGNPAFSM